MHLSITEYGRSALWRWGGDTLETLRSESLRWKQILGLSKPPFAVGYAGRNKYRIRAEGVTGFIQAGGVSIEVQPKFLRYASKHTWRQALWQILAAVEESPKLGGLSTAGVTSEESFQDLLGWTLLDSLNRGRLEGYPRGYVETSDSLSVLRGRLDASRISELITQPYRVPCIFDSYSEDIPINRLLRWATQILASLVRSPRLSRLLYDEVATFTDISLTPPGLVEAEHITLPFQYQHLAPALQVSRLLLRRQSLQHEQEEYKAPSFLWNSADVFQKFIKYLLEKVAEIHGWVLEVGGQVLADRMTSIGGAARRILTFPDYRILQASRPLLILDAKYKVWTAKTKQPRVQDVYQVMAGGRVSGCDKVFLIYPSSDTREPISWSLRGGGHPTTVAAAFVDLTEMGGPSGEISLVNKLDQDLSRVVTGKTVAHS